MAARKSRKTAKGVKKATGKRSASKAAKTRRAAHRSSADPSASERIDRMITELGDWRGERLAWIRRLVHEADPEVVEHWKWMGTPVWSNQGMYALANAHKHKVKLTFFHGAHLSDPKRLFNAGLDGNKWRAIDLHEKDSVDERALVALLRRAVAFNAKHSVPKSRGSRA